MPVPCPAAPSEERCLCRPIVKAVYLAGVEGQGGEPLEVVCQRVALYASPDIDNIDKGYKLQDMEGKLEDKEKLKFNTSIIIAPDYQREYRFKLDDEVKLVESVFLGIPIPPIFFATDKYKDAQVRNVVDGQHRLRALHRFYNGKFKLENLELLPELNNKYFEDLDIELKGDYLDAKIDTITFSDFPVWNLKWRFLADTIRGQNPYPPKRYAMLHITQYLILL